jgi:hypothetical protein
MFQKGDKGIIHIPYPFYCPTSISLEISGKIQVFDFPLPVPDKSIGKFDGKSVGLSYQAIYFQQLSEKGKKESDLETLEESLGVMNIMDRVRKQIGMIYPSEKV